MDREERLLLRLERQEKSFEEAKKLLVEAQKGFLRELGWRPLSKSEEYWSDPWDGISCNLAQAIDRAKGQVRSAVLGPG